MEGSVMILMNDWTTVEGAAKRKGCTTANIIYCISAGKVEAVKGKGKWKINPETLESEKDFSSSSDVLSVLEGQLKV